MVLIPGHTVCAMLGFQYICALNKIESCSRLRCMKLVSSHLSWTESFLQMNCLKRGPDIQDNPRWVSHDSCTFHRWDITGHYHSSSFLSLPLELALLPLRAQDQLGSQGKGDRVHFSAGSPQPTVCKKCQWYPLSFTVLSLLSVMSEELCCSLLTAGEFNVCKLRTRSKLT